MHPILFETGGLTIYTYGFFVALGLLTAMGVTSWLAKKKGIAPDHIMNICFYGVLAGLVGARLLYVIINPAEFLDHPLNIFKVWNGGLVFFGAFFGALVFVLGYVRKNDLPLGTILDLAALFAPLAQAIGRLGCFSAGCCYGKICDLPWAVTFTDPHTLAWPRGLPLHPTQLYSSLSNFAIFGLLLALFLGGRFTGRLFLVYLVIYGLSRSFIEMFRGDPRGTILADSLSTSQAIGLSAAAVAAAVLVLLHLRDKRRNT
ncbi:MAG: prolipoprotein diacylglyceryl transferase [Desulfosudaceae bacterium]